ncbi:MAG: GntR family transcriptional regulator [Betaproteobacteria bacterium]|nr:GntR family transcriptional regulator [Betaproteobacteria bacterium]
MKAASIRRNSKVRPAKSPRTTESAIPVDKLDRIARLIEEDIVAGKMQPGQRLDERALAERFGVSRTPIREVLVRLSSLGVVELRRNQGAFVAEMSSAKLIGMLEVMAEVEFCKVDRHAGSDGRGEDTRRAPRFAQDDHGRAGTAAGDPR